MLLFCITFDINIRVNLYFCVISLQTQCAISSVDTEALVLKHQAISYHSADLLCVVLDQFQREIISGEQHKKLKSYLQNNDPVV